MKVFVTSQVMPIIDEKKALQEAWEKGEEELKALKNRNEAWNRIPHFCRDISECTNLDGTKDEEYFFQICCYEEEKTGNLIISMKHDEGRSFKTSETYVSYCPLCGKYKKLK
jgi:redox-regulated HSP33 family molecular chaperone